MQKPKTHIQYLEWLGIIFLLILSISACSKPSRRLALPGSASPTRSASPTYTAALSPSPSPTKIPTLTLIATRNATRTPTSTPSRTPKPTRTVTPTPTRTRWVATGIPLVWETPTPLPTPPVKAVDYQLKVWSEADALGLVKIAEQFSFADNIPMPFGEKRFNYRDDQAAIRLAAQEALHRFPEASFKEKLEWRIALADTIQDSSVSYAWILQQIEDSLNRGRVSPDNLDSLLNPFGFQVGEQRDAPNLFGDGQLAQVIYIIRLDRGSTGLYAALRHDSQGFYTLVWIFNTWDFNFGFDGWYGEDGYNYLRIEDHTGDGIPEVILHPGYHNGSFCGYDLVIFQWSRSQFVRADQNQFQLDECNADETWKYGTPGENGAEPIEIRKSASLYSGVWQDKIFVWNGERYELSESRLEVPKELDRAGSRWVTFAMDDGDYTQISEKIPQFLSDDSRVQERALELGPSYPDYLRFQLGLAYAFQSNVVQARAVFEQIIQDPGNPLTPTIPQAAQAYLDNYKSDADLYRACQAALNVMKKAAGNSDITRLKEVWGYQPDDFGSSYNLCSLSMALKQIMLQMKIAQFTKAPEILEQARVSIRYAIEADLDQNGQKEWVLFVDTPEWYSTVNIWVLVNIPDGALPINVVNPYIPDISTITTVPEIKVSTALDGSVIDFIRIGDILYVFRFDGERKVIDQFLWPKHEVESYTSNRRGSGLELEVISSEYCDHCKETYRWLNNTFNVIYDDKPDSDQVAEVEQILLASWNLDEAIPLLVDYSQYTAYFDRPRLLYLLGLAYELAGDGVHAVQDYWDLWHAYPESVYARLAQAKLELKK